MIKRTNRLALAAMRDVAVVWSSETHDQSVTLYSIKTCSPIAANEFHFHAIQKMQHRWAMVLIAVGVSDDEKYMKVEPHVLTDPRFHTATIDYFNEQHEALLNAINANHGRKAAWIATIKEREFTEDQLWGLTGL